MKRIILSLLVMAMAYSYCCAQNYSNILNYNNNGTPAYGVKIKTNLPYTEYSQMPTISIKGYNYITGDVIDLTLAYYIYGGEFINHHIVSAGSYSPPCTFP